jgi:hypothetical protein
MKARFLSGILALNLATAGARAEPLPTELRVLDREGVRLEGANLQASLSRTLPEELGGLPGPDRDALRFLLIGPPDSSLDKLEVLTSSAQGRPQDVIVNFRTEPVTCPDGVAPEQVWSP